MLTSLGSVSASPAPHHVSRAFVRALGSFGSGVFLAACMGVAAYAANHRYAESVGAMAAAWTHPYNEPTDNAWRHDRWARHFHTAGCGFAAGILLAFLGGVTAAAVGFVHLR